MGQLFRKLPIVIYHHSIYIRNFIVIGFIGAGLFSGWLFYFLSFCYLCGSLSQIKFWMLCMVEKHTNSSIEDLNYE